MWICFVKSPIKIGLPPTLLFDFVLVEPCSIHRHWVMLDRKKNGQDVGRDPLRNSYKILTIPIIWSRGMNVCFSQVDRMTIWVSLITWHQPVLTVVYYLCGLLTSQYSKTCFVVFSFFRLLWSRQFQMVVSLPTNLNITRVAWPSLMQFRML